MDGSLVFKCEIGVSGAVISSADAAAAEVNAGLCLFFFHTDPLVSNRFKLV